VIRTLRSTAAVLGTSALLLAAAAGPASAQGSLQFALPDLGSLAQQFGVPLPAVAPEATGDPTTDITTRAFAGRLTGAFNDTRTATGAPRLVTKPELQSSAERSASTMALADKLSPGLPEAPGAKKWESFALEMPADAKPEAVVAKVMADPAQGGMITDRAFDSVGAGVAAAKDGSLYIVVGLADF